MTSECCTFSPSLRNSTWIQMSAIPNESVVSQTTQNLKVKGGLSGHKSHFMKISNGLVYSGMALELVFSMNMRSELTAMYFDRGADICIVVVPHHVQVPSFHGYGEQNILPLSLKLYSAEIPLADTGSLTTGSSADSQAGFEIGRLPKPTWRIRE